MSYNYNINTIKITIDTNIPKKQPVIFTKDLLYHPLLKNMDSLNEYPYFILTAKYPKFAIDKLTYQQKVDFFFKKDYMINILKRNNVTVTENTRQNIKQIDKSLLNSNKTKITKLLEEKKSNIESFKNKIFKKIIFDETELFLRNSILLKIDNNNELIKVDDLAKLKKFFKDIIDKENDMLNKDTKIDQSKLIEMIEKKIVETKSYFIDSFDKYNIKNEEDQRKIDDIQIEYINDIENKYEQTKEELYAASDINAVRQTYILFLEDKMKLFLEMLENNRKYKLNEIENSNKQEIKKLNPPDNEDKLDTPVNKKENEQKSEIATYNILCMIHFLFPTNYPVFNNFNDSYSMIINHSNRLWDNFSLTEIIPSTLREQIFEEQAFSSYLNIDGKKYTITQIIWVNDIYNHPKYKSLIEKYKELIEWQVEEKKKITLELSKKQTKFREEFRYGKIYHIDEEDIEKLESQIVIIDKYLSPTEITNRADKNENIEKIVGYINQLNSYIEINPTDYDLIADIANNIDQRYSKIKDKLERNKKLDKKFDELKKQIEIINTLDKVNDNYISKPGINMNFEKEEANIKDMLKNKYSKYTNFSSYLSEFIAPKLESTNYELQNTFTEFLDNTDKLQLFNALMNPIYINNIGQYLREIKNSNNNISGSIDKDEYNNRLNTGISIVQGNESGPKYEITLRMDVVAGEITKESRSKINCPYTGESLGNNFEKLLNAKYINEWELSPNRFFFDVTEKLEKIQKESKQEGAFVQKSIKGGKIYNIKYNTRKLRSNIIKTRKLYN